MSLSDVVSGAGLHSWSELGLIICFVTFVALLIWLFAVRRGPVFERERALPLEEGPLAPSAGADVEVEPPGSTEEVEHR